MTKTTKSPTRGKHFKPGQSGNPKGRPKGRRSRPKETTVDEEIEALTLRGMEHVAAGHIDAARNCFTKMYILTGPPCSAAELRDDADRLIKVVVEEVEKLQRLDIVRSLYDDAVENENPAYLQHVGLSPDATWEQFRALYAVGDDHVDVDRATGDLVTFPPVAAAIAERQARSAA